MTFKDPKLATRYFESAAEYLSQLMAYEYLDGIIETTMIDVRVRMKKQALKGHNESYYLKTLVGLQDRKSEIYKQYQVLKNRVETQVQSLGATYNVLKAQDDAVNN
jgi:hypothetical protein